MATSTSLDRILSVEPGQAARALRNVPNTLAVLDTHFPRFGVLPGVLILESLAELARIAADGPPERWRLAAVSRVQFRRFVRPGDQLELSVEVTKHSESAASVRGEVRVAGRLVAAARELRLEAR